MNDPVFWRLVWKEYRSQRAFWISMVIIALLMHVCVLAFARGGDATARTLLEIGLALSALYALGCGATLFATEHEAETYEFQRALPVRAGRLFLGKTAFAVAGTLVMVAVQWLLAATLGGWRSLGSSVHGQTWGSWGFGAVELLVWGTFFSLLLKRPLMAAILAVLTASVTVHVIVAEFGRQYFRQPYVDALPYRGAFIVVVGVVTVWLGFRWFRERPCRSAGGLGLYPDVRVTADGAGPARAFLRKQGGVLRRLLWQQLRQSIGMLILLTAMVVPLLLIAVCVSFYVSIGGRRLPAMPPELGFSFGLSFFLALLAAPLAGACVFLGDQRRRGFRFLAERGVPPRSVWLSRQVIWGTPALGYAALILVFFVAMPLSGELSPEGVLVQFVGTAFGFVILAYAAGQLCSMFFASGILALFFSIALTWALCCWAALMAYLDVPWLWSAVPIPLVLLLATWLRTPHWLLERNTLRAWMPIALTLALPALAIIAGVCAHRVYSVPLVDPGFDPQAFAQPGTSEARETAEMYRRALDMYLDNPFEPPKREAGAVETPTGPAEPLTAMEMALVDHYEAALRLAVEAGQRPSCSWFSSGTTWRHSWVNLGSVGRLLVTSARRLQSEGDLDAALERYLAALRLSARLRRGESLPSIGSNLEQQVYEYLPSWAAHADQTPERIKAAIAQVEAAQQGMTVPSDGIKADYLKLRAKLDRDLAVRLFDLDYREGDGFVLALQRLPWEAGRSRRVLNLFTDRDLDYCNRVESAVRAGEPVEFPGAPEFSPHWQASLRTTPWIERFYGFSKVPSLTSGFILTETRRRAVRLQMALAGWKTEQGELPERLDQLVGPFLKQLPTDPFTQQPFEYFPKGLSQPEVHESRDVLQPDVRYGEVISPGKPLLRTPPTPGRFFDGRSSRRESSVFEIPGDE